MGPGSASRQMSEQVASSQPCTAARAPASCHALHRTEQGNLTAQVQRQNRFPRRSGRGVGNMQLFTGCCVGCCMQEGDVLR